MSHRVLGLRGRLRLVRRRWAAVVAATVLGLAAGAVYAAVTPPLLASQAIVLLTPASPGAMAQAAVAHSDAILSLARREISPAISLPTVRSRVRVTSLTPRVLSIRAQGATAAQAEGLANAVARCFIAYVRAPSGTVGQEPASLLDTAEAATGTPLARRLATFGGLGAVLGALIGALGALAVRRPASPLPEGNGWPGPAASRA